MATRATFNSHSVGLGTTTTGGRAAGVGTDAGTLAYDAEGGTLDVYNGNEWLNIRNVNAVTQYFIYTSPTTADLTGTYAWDPTATVDIVHMTPGGSGSTGQGGCGGTNNCGGGGAGGSGGTLTFRTGLTIGNIAPASSVPITLPSAPGPVMPGSSPGGSGGSGGGYTPGGGCSYSGNPGSDASLTIAPWSPAFPDYSFTNGEGGLGAPGTSCFGGNGGSGGGGGMLVTRSSSEPTALVPNVPTPSTGNDGNQAAGLCEYSSNGARGGEGATGFGGGGGGGGGGSECGGGTTGGAGGGSGAPGIMIIKVSGFA